MIRNQYGIYLLSLLYAILFVYIIPWVELNPMGEFADIPNYLDRIVYLKGNGQEAEYWGISWLLSEPLWKEMILFMGYAFEDYRLVLYGISLIVTFIYTSFLLKRVEFYVAMIFLFNPMMVNLFLEQIRIALAFSFVLLSYDIIERRKSIDIFPILLLFMAFLIHASMIVFYGIFYLLYRLNQKVEDKKYYLIAIATALFIALFMKYGSNILLMIAGDRRADYGEVIQASSLSFSIAWFIIAMIIGTFAEFQVLNERVLVAYAITIMCFFFFSSLLGMFAMRYVAVSMPAIIIAIKYLPKHYKQGTYLFLLAYNIFSFKYWLKLTIM